MEAIVVLGGDKYQPSYSTRFPINFHDGR